MVFNDYYVPLWCFIQSKCDRECFDVSKELGQLPSEWVPCSDTLSIIRRYFTGTRTHPLPALSNFRVTLILDNLLRLKNETAVCVHLSLSSQDLKCDQNIGRYYFNFPAPCSLPILFSAAWCNNKCYLDPYLVRGRNGSVGSDDSLIRPAPNNFLALSLSLFIRVWAGQSEHWVGTYLFVTKNYEAQYDFLPPNMGKYSSKWFVKKLWRPKKVET